MKHLSVLRMALLAAFVLAAAHSSRAEEKQEAPTGGAAVAKKVDPEEFDRLRKGKDAVVLDVRTPREFKAGRIAGAMNLSVYNEQFDERLKAMDKDKPYLVHCAIGGRSATAVERMRALGFKKLYDLEGGIQAWEKAGKPVEKEAGAPE